MASRVMNQSSGESIVFYLCAAVYVGSVVIESDHLMLGSHICGGARGNSNKCLPEVNNAIDV